MELMQRLREGAIDGAVAELAERVRRTPTSLEVRYSLTTLFAMRGEFERAQEQLDVIGAQDVATLPGVRLYQSLLSAELERQNVWDGIGVPEVVGGSAAARLRATLPGALGEGDLDAIAATLTELEQREPAVPAMLNGRRVSRLRDSDDFLGPVLEVFANGHYQWLPFGDLRSVRLDAPTTLFDLLWARARVTNRSDATMIVHVPVLYAETHTSEDGLVRAGHKSEWIAIGELGYRGRGGRVFFSDDEQIGLLETRGFELEEAEGTP